jgi:hypothetical protein
MRTAERIGCNARVRALLRTRRGNPLYLGRTRRLVSPAQMTALQIRDQGRCQFPGCEHTLHLQAHHIVHVRHEALDYRVGVKDRHSRAVTAVPGKLRAA